MALFRNKPVTIEAIQWNGRNEMEIARFVGGNIQMGDDELLIHTPEGTITVLVGDYVVKDVNGEFYYSCEPDIFEKTYEPVAEECRQ